MVFQNVFMMLFAAYYDARSDQRHYVIISGMYQTARRAAPYEIE